METALFHVAIILAVPLAPRAAPRGRPCLCFLAGCPCSLPSAARLPTRCGSRTWCPRQPSPGRPALAQGVRRPCQPAQVPRADDAVAAARAFLNARPVPPLRSPTDGGVPPGATLRARAPSPSATEPASGLGRCGRRPPAPDPPLPARTGYSRCARRTAAVPSSVATDADSTAWRAPPLWQGASLPVHSGGARSPGVHAHICTHYPASPIISAATKPAPPRAATLDRPVLAASEARRKDA